MGDITEFKDTSCADMIRNELYEIWGELLILVKQDRVNSWSDRIKATKIRTADLLGFLTTARAVVSDDGTDDINELSKQAQSCLEFLDRIE